MCIRDSSIFERRLGIDRLAGEQRIGCTFHPEQLLKAAVDALSRHRSDVVMQIVDDRVLAADRDVAHQAHFGMESRTVDHADGRNFGVVDQRADVDAARRAPASSRLGNGPSVNLRLRAAIAESVTVW